MKTVPATAPPVVSGGYKLSGLLVALSLVLCQMAPAQAEVSVGINIGVNVPVYPRLVPVPGYPVYYDPTANANYFFYDGLYWVYQNDNWYASSWYNGPWQLTEPEYVPLFILRVPVRYYRQPPPYFHGWRDDRPPHWGEHWGNDWKQRHSGWNQWDHNAAPHPAPLPRYQRQYSGDRYPHVEQQQGEIRSQNYHYQPREPVTQQHFQQQAQPAQQPQAAPQNQGRDNHQDNGHDNRQDHGHDSRDDRHDQDHH
jgi:hypothetical protein